ncbi:EGF-like repeat and discoidin I-like domain-containing protein 3 [Oculina patagonica]
MVSLPFLVVVFVCKILSILASQTVAWDENTLSLPVITRNNRRLKGFTFNTFHSTSLVSCGLQCQRNPRCVSTNFRKVSSLGETKGICELNGKGILLHFEAKELEYDEEAVYTQFYDTKLDCQLTGCLNAGSSIFSEVSKIFICKCTDAWSGNYCRDINHCVSHPCMNGGSCKNLADGHVCSCTAGYTGSQCEQACSVPLGLESGAILDSQITASSVWDVYHAAHQARLHFKVNGVIQGGWSARLNDNNQWLQVDLQQRTRVTRIATQGRNGYEPGQWVTKYKLQYGEDGETFKFYRRIGDHSDTIFQGNIDTDSVVYHELNPITEARYIRVRPTQWNKHISMRMELYTYCLTVQEESSPSPTSRGDACNLEMTQKKLLFSLGLSRPSDYRTLMSLIEAKTVTGCEIATSFRLSTSSLSRYKGQKMHWRVPCFFLFGSFINFVTSDDRCRTEVNTPGMALKGFVFKKMPVTAPHKCDVRCEQEITCQSYNYVIEKNLCELNNRTKEATPENFRSDPASFYIRRLNGRAPLGSIPELPAQSCQEIKASEGKDTISSKYWLDPAGNGTAVLVYCDMNLAVCTIPLGMESGVILDSQITASSVYDANHAAHQARLHFKESGKIEGGWSTLVKDNNQWLQVDLLQLTMVTGIATQGRNSSKHSQWVTKYKLQYSEHGHTFTLYRRIGDHSDTVFLGNTDKDTVVYHNLNPIIEARYIRVRPTEWHTWISMRIELYSC